MCYGRGQAPVVSTGGNGSPKRELSRRSDTSRYSGVEPTESRFKELSYSRRGNLLLVNHGR
jgi:hypothetical protein